VALILASACGRPTEPPIVGTDFKLTETQTVFDFHLSLPPGWEFRRLQGTDSSVGEITGDGVTLGLDYGWYSDPLSAENYPGQAESYVIIDGQRAKITVPNVVGDGIVGVHFPDLGSTGGSKIRLTILGSQLTASQQSTALAIFRSIRFTG
jgi:hypothetical protein